MTPDPQRDVMVYQVAMVDALSGASIGERWTVWLGTDSESGVAFEIEAYDAKGVKITLDKKAGKGWTSVHFKPEKTGTCLVTFKITGKDKEVIPWALVYGWK